MLFNISQCHLMPIFLQTLFVFRGTSSSSAEPQICRRKTNNLGPLVFFQCEDKQQIDAMKPIEELAKQYKTDIKKGLSSKKAILPPRTFLTGHHGKTP